MKYTLTPDTDFLAGELILIDKFINWTSFDVVNKIRYQLKFKRQIPKIKVGHAGTLDPLATGLLILCTGKKTKELEKYQAEKKEYITTLKLGASTPSHDLETEIDKVYPTEDLTDDKIREVVDRFRGKQEQLPPSFSAKRVNGKRSYNSARKGKHLDLKPVPVEIYEIEILKINLPEVELRISCSKGTYIRAIARDIGKALNNGAHLTALRRTKIGEFNVEDAITVEEFEKLL